MNYCIAANAPTSIYPLIRATDVKDHTGKCCVILMLRIFVWVESEKFASPLSIGRIQLIELWFIALRNGCHPASVELARRRYNYQPWVPQPFNIDELLKLWQQRRQWQTKNERIHCANVLREDAFAIINHREICFVCVNLMFYNCRGSKEQIDCGWCISSIRIYKLPAKENERIKILWIYDKTREAKTKNNRMPSAYGFSLWIACNLFVNKMNKEFTLDVQAHQTRNNTEHRPPIIIHIIMISVFVCLSAQRSFARPAPDSSATEQWACVRRWCATIARIVREME